MHRKIVAALALVSLIAMFGTARAVDSDRVEGSGKEMKGDVEQGAGRLTGDQQLQSKGRSDQTTGKVQNAWGQTKDAARGVGDAVESAVGGK